MAPSAATPGTNRLTDTLRWWWGVVLIGVATTVVTAAQPFDNGPPIRSDGYGYHAWTYAILRGDLSSEGFANETYAFHETRPGYWWNVYPPGVALARFPVMAPLVSRGEQFGRPTVAEHVAMVVLSALALVGTAVQLAYVCRKAGAADAGTNLAILAVVFGTGLFHYATYDASYSHVWSALGLTTLVALVARSVTRGGRIPAAGLVLLAAWLMLVRNTNGFALVLLGGSYLLLAPKYLDVSRQTAVRNVLWLAGGALFGAGMQVALNTYAHARFTLSSYQGELFVWDRPMQWSVLTSVAEHGLFPYYPVTAVLLLSPLAVPRLRPFTLAFAVLLAVYCMLYGYWTMWNLGASFGHRGFVDVLPLGAPLIAVALTQLAKWPRRATILGIFLCTYATVSLMAGYWRRSVPYHEISPDTYRAHVVGREQLVLVALRRFG